MQKKKQVPIVGLKANWQQCSNLSPCTNNWEADNALHSLSSLFPLSSLLLLSPVGPHRGTADRLLTDQYHQKSPNAWSVPYLMCFTATTLLATVCTVRTGSFKPNGHGDRLEHWVLTHYFKPNACNLILLDEIHVVFLVCYFVVLCRPSISLEQHNLMYLEPVGCFPPSWVLWTVILACSSYCLK